MEFFSCSWLPPPSVRPGDPLSGVCFQNAFCMSLCPTFEPEIIPKLQHKPENQGNSVNPARANLTDDYRTLKPPVSVILYRNL